MAHVRIMLIFNFFVWTLCFVFSLAKENENGGTHVNTHHPNHHHHHQSRYIFGNSSRDFILAVPTASPLIKYAIPPFRANKSVHFRAFYQWNHNASAFKEIYRPLPDNSIYLSHFRNKNIKKSKSTVMQAADDTTQGQLQTMLELISNKTQGIFLDLATNHYKIGSNTVFLEYFFHWSGICIEPNEEYINDIVAHRQCILVASPVFHTNNVLVPFHLNEGLGGIVADEYDNAKAKKNIAYLPTVTLDTILDTFYAQSTKNHPISSNITKPIRVFDYFNLDIEGAEFDAVSHLDFSRTIFRVLSVERPKDYLHELLVKNGYWFVCQTYRTEPFGDVFYVHFTHPNFFQIMDKYRSSTSDIGKRISVKYVNEYKWYNPVYLLKPAWPPGNHHHPESDHSQKNIDPSSNIYKSPSFLAEDDIVKCGESTRQLYLIKGGKFHAIPSLGVFQMIGDGKRDFSETIVVSSKLCALWKERKLWGKDLNEQNVKLHASDPFWTAFF